MEYCICTGNNVNMHKYFTFSCQFTTHTSLLVILTLHIIRRGTSFRIAIMMALPNLINPL